MNAAENEVILQVALTFDHDAISSDVEKGHRPFDRSIGEFGPRVGLPRILEILARTSTPATFFVPVHTAHTWPASLAAIVAGGHEIGCHGWAHEDHATLPANEERDLIVRQKAALTAAATSAGYTAPIVGFRAPYWSLSEQTLQFVEEAGFTYDSSLAWEETRITPVRHGDQHAIERSTLGTAGTLLDVPISHWLDDWPWFEPGRGGGPAAAPSAFAEVALAELRLAHARGLADPSLRSGVLTYTFHPECIGRGSRAEILEAIIAAGNALGGVRFTTLAQAVASLP
jgi:peptidoglycan/xylan/chitin deacetylase (PgdA/CDA1 family)